MCSSDLPEHPFDQGALKIRDEKLAGFPRKPDVIDRKSVVEGKSVDLGGRRIIKKKRKRCDDRRDD